MNILLTTAVAIAAANVPRHHIIAPIHQRIINTTAIAETIECPMENNSGRTCFKVGDEIFSTKSDIDWYRDRDRITVEFSWCDYPKDNVYTLCGIDIIAGDKSKRVARPEFK